VLVGLVVCAGTYKLGTMSVDIFDGVGGGGQFEGHHALISGTSTLAGALAPLDRSGPRTRALVVSIRNHRFVRSTRCARACVARVPLLRSCVRKLREFSGCSRVQAVEAATLHPAQVGVNAHRMWRVHRTGCLPAARFFLRQGCPSPSHYPPPPQTHPHPHTHIRTHPTPTPSPVQVLGLRSKLGALDVGCVADLVVLDDDLNVLKTFINGNLEHAV
jgi:hypothetical protein